ncbi:SMC-Scp complex subunit ScpB [Acidiferrimicrobium sp. IK]|uniref:SMC-Scp complex subunit ScpB n=1 Tax=Acidiferrimicrobium sp. IK TaxID=2871700 RepID=UPI0021CB2734|nr:SMC-Scp complex subunit ScpB [Acidiferrimicrobium sp. IK]MCU4184734.1 SMC-Scp complex subunit ScpB [Acidiferrimicrobium sp. IK]
MASEATRAIEAILMVADSPVEPGILAQLLEMPPLAIEQLCDQLSAEYRESDRGFVLARVAGGYRFQSHGDMAPYVERFVLEGQSARMSAAALETLAIVAYKQPVSRAQIASIRGVNADGVMRTLQQRGFITEIGRDPGPGQAVLYGTTPLFLERLGIDKLGDLPPLADFVPGPEVMEALEHSLQVGPAAAEDAAAAAEAEMEMAPNDQQDLEPPAAEPEAADPAPGEDEPGGEQPGGEEPAGQDLAGQEAVGQEPADGDHGA